MIPGIYAEFYTNKALPDQTFVKKVSSFTGYEHTIQAIGGFWSAQLSFATTRADMEEWYENGLGREVRVFDHEGNMIFQGSVNMITVPIGGLSITRGPLLDICNRASVIYTPRDFTVYPPVDGIETTTIVVDNSDSTSIYGIVEKVITGGTISKDAANIIRGTYLNTMAWPKSSGQINISDNVAEYQMVTLDCVGFAQWLAVWVYDNFTDNYSYASDKLKAVLAADPNGLVSNGGPYIDDNLFLASNLEEGSRTAWDVIQELIALGDDTTNQRMTFGVYENGECDYHQAGAVTTYEHVLTNQIQRVVMAGTHDLVYPWMVRPGHWITVPDFLPGHEDDLYWLNPNNKFIEAVTFTAPYSVSLQCGDYDEVSQLLAKITYQGGLY